jgi:hypothetical protein
MNTDVFIINTPLGAALGFDFSLLINNNKEGLLLKILV